MVVQGDTIKANPHDLISGETKNKQIELES